MTLPFTYEGYTYERFKSISPGTTYYWEKKILENADKIYSTFIFIKKHKDTREYLLAMHYNRELRYFAENPNEKIPENSIINKLIPRNISIIIRKIWKRDQNKFIIVCRDLIIKRKLNGGEPIGNSALSMLTYILAYLDKIPDHIHEEIKGMLVESVDNKNLNLEIGSLDTPGEVSWEISGNNVEKMKRFIDLNFIHSQKILKAMNLNNSSFLVKELLNSPSFTLYNRQYMMWYYGDLTIYGESTINNLVPGKNIINKGFDYYNCFYTLYQKIYDYFENEGSFPYPLLAFDLYTICDLVYSRHIYNNGNEVNAYDDGKRTDVYSCVKNMLEKYIEYYKNTKDEEKDEECIIDETEEKNLFQAITLYLNKIETINTKRYVYLFFKILSKNFLKCGK